jgi:hypothetical protein
MQKQTLLVYCLFAFSYCTFSQQETLSEVSVWINEHPDIIFIEENNLQNFSKEELAKFSGKYIVFNNEIHEQDILKYDPAYLDKTLDNKEPHSSKKEVTTQDQVKMWLDKNAHVKIVKRSEYLAESSAVQTEYIGNKCLILRGERITIEDVNNYQP